LHHTESTDLQTGAIQARPAYRRTGPAQVRQTSTFRDTNGQNGMLLLTPPTWSGLPLYTCPDGKEVRLFDVELGDDLLVLWRTSGSVVEVRKSALQRWTYTSRAGHFDFVAAGRFQSVSCSAPAASPLIVGLPRELVHDVLPADATGARSLPGESQFQFQLRSLSKLVTTLEAHHLDDEPLGRGYTRALSGVIVDRLMAMASPPGDDDHPGHASAVPRVILDLIERQLDNLPGLVALAALAGMNTNQFLKWFRRHVGVTPHQYIMRKRIERAMRQLEQPYPVSLTALALQLGFNSHAHFTSVFRSQTGQTPSAYRRTRLAATQED
jgi:AraC family transcriptional regulator